MIGTLQQKEPQAVAPKAQVEYEENARQIVGTNTVYHALLQRFYID